VTAGTAGVFAQTEGTAPSTGLPAVSVDGCWADSTTHAYKCSFNNDTAQPLMRDSSTTTTTTYVPIATAQAGVYAPGPITGAMLPNPTALALGGVESVTCTGSQFLNAINTSGVPICGTPVGAGNVSNSGTPTNGQMAQWTNATTIQGLAVTGTGNAVLATSPTLVTPAISGVLSSYDGITTVGTGVPVIGWQSSLSNSSATSAVTLATAPGAGDYIIEYSLDLHTACTTGSETVSLGFGWTGNSSRTATTGNWTIGTAQNASGYFSGRQPIHVVSGTVTFTPAASGCATGTATWDGLVNLTRVN
jgi:hypothetical protein